MKNAESHNRCSVTFENPIKTVGFSDSDRARFWSFVNREGACWLWLGARIGDCGRSQYGAFSMPRVPVRGRKVSIPRYAHRVAWELTHGPIPEGLNVCHRCDVPLCVNPGHLFVGTQLDNMRDAKRKGRLHVQRRGRQVLNDSQIAEIVALRQSGVTLLAIADRYGVSKGFVSMVARGKRRPLSPSVAA